MSKIFKILFMAIFIGVASGVLSALFLHSLSYVTRFREMNTPLIWGLPVFGFLFALLIKKIPHHVNQGVPYILKELDNHDAKVSLWMAPFIFFSSLGTHLFGGSAGREGVGVIMGASIAHLLPKFHPCFEKSRTYLIYGGIAAGFSSIFGTPVAALIFAFELRQFKDVKDVTLLICTAVASFTAYFIPLFLGIHHEYREVHYELGRNLFVYVLVAGLTSGLGGHFFYWGLKGYTKLISHIFSNVGYKLFFGGLFVALLVYFTDSFSYIGIGVDMIERSFDSQMSFHDFMMKCLLTVMTLAVGFKGGEVTPLFFMGATFSNSTLSFLSFKNFSLSSSLGMVSLFGAVVGTPIASAMMGGELFGWRVGLLSFLSCLIARVIIGKRSVYRH